MDFTYLGLIYLHKKSPHIAGLFLYIVKILESVDLAVFLIHVSD